MTVLGDQTREQLRVAIGRNLGAVYLGTMSANGTTTTVVDSTLRGGADSHNGKHMWFTGPSNNDGTYRRVNDFACITLTADAEAITATVACDTYELWLSNFDPRLVNEFINTTIRDTYGVVWDDVVDRTLHGSDRVSRFDIPTGISMLTEVQYRQKVRDRIVLPVRVWDESIDANFTVTVDAEDPLYARRPTKFVVAAGVSCGDIASDSICSTDYSGFTHIEFPIKVSAAVAASDLAFRLDDTACNGSPIETLLLPAITARTDTWIRLPLATPELDTAIVSVAIEYNANAGANTIWIGESRASVADTEDFVALHPREWSMDRPNRAFRLTPGGRNRVGYQTIQLIGGDEPTTLCADSTINEVDDYFVVARTTELMLNALGSARTDKQERDRLYWHAESTQARKAFIITPNIRQVE